MVFVFKMVIGKVSVKCRKDNCLDKWTYWTKSRLMLI